jgi:hypothetical protein
MDDKFLGFFKPALKSRKEATLPAANQEQRKNALKTKSERC